MGVGGMTVTGMDKDEKTVTAENLSVIAKFQKNKRVCEPSARTSIADAGHL